MDRRNFIKNAVPTAICASAAPSLLSMDGPHGPGLKDIGARCNRRIGVWTDRWMIDDPVLRPLILQNFNHTTIGNLKWDFLRKTEGEWNFGPVDYLVDFSKSNGLSMHGHALCYNGYNPKWLVDTLNHSNAERLLTEEINTVMTRYKGRITSYDVVNEPIALWFKRPDGLYTGPWLDALGPGYIDIAFHAAAQADRDALRVLNLHHVEQIGDDAARDKALALIKDLVKRNVPVQAVGMESHLMATTRSGSSPSRDNFIKSLKDLGLQVVISEIDVNDTNVKGSVDDHEAAVAASYKEYLTTLVPLAQPKWITFFTFTDRLNWIDAADQKPFSLPDKPFRHPGLLDRVYHPKPSMAATISALEATCR